MSENKTILVVEDEPPLREAIQFKLTKHGFRCILAMNAEEALLMLEKEKPDLVWLDLLMPGMGGFALLEQLRKNPKWKTLPVVIVSVSSSPEKIRHAFELNILEYLVKSEYKLEDLITRVSKLLI